MKKPQPKTEIAIERIFYHDHSLVLYATPDAIAEFSEFGSVMSWEGEKDKYWLYVDGRFDFNEVVQYIRDYGKGS